MLKNKIKQVYGVSIITADMSACVVLTLMQVNFAHLKMRFNLLNQYSNTHTPIMMTERKDKQKGRKTIPTLLTKQLL